MLEVYCTAAVKRCKLAYYACKLLCGSKLKRQSKYTVGE